MAAVDQCVKLVRGATSDSLCRICGIGGGSGLDIGGYSSRRRVIGGGGRFDIGDNSCKLVCDAIFGKCCFICGICGGGC